MSEHADTVTTMDLVAMVGVWDSCGWLLLQTTRVSTGPK